MKLNHVELCGFRGFRDRVRIDFGTGFTVITGRNGAGKSTVCDAIEYALTGEIDKYRVEKAVRESIADYVWWRGEGRPQAHFVTVGFEDDQGQQLTVTRTRESGASVPPDEIERWLCIDARKPEQALRQACRTSIIRDEWIAQTSLDLKETERFDMVRTALGAVEGPEYLRKSQEVLAEADKTARSAEQDYERSRADLARDLAELARLRESVTAAGDVAEALATLGGDPSSDLSELIGLARQDLSKRQVKANEMARLVEQARAVAQAREQLAASASRDEVELAEAAQLAFEVDAVAAEDALASAERELAAEREADALASSLAALIEHGEHLGLDEGHCPLCAAARSVREFDFGLERARARLATFGMKVVSAGSRVRQAREVADVARQLAKDTADEVAALKSREGVLAAREADLAIRLERLGIDARAASDPDLGDEIALRERNALIDLERGLLMLEASRAVEDLAESETRVQRLRGEVDAAAGRLARAQSAALVAKSLDRSVKRTNAEIVDERLATISPLLNELYQRLRPHREWREIDYNIRGDVRRLLSLKVGGGLNPQFVFSSGQRRAAGLAFLLSVYLSRSWCSWKTLVLDDPVQHIDDFRALHLVELLAAIRLSGRQIVCAVEDGALAELLCRRLASTADQPGRQMELDMGDGGAVSVVSSRTVEAAPARVPNLRLAG